MLVGTYEKYSDSFFEWFLLFDCHYGMGGFILEKATQFINILAYGEEKSICISTGSPFIYNDWFPAAKNFLNLYCICPEYFEALVAGIYGECELTGTCSFNADPLAPRL